jgi:hypothetical protein
MDCTARALTEFFNALQYQKAHWYRVFPPDKNEADYSKLDETFPSLSSLMMMEESYVEQLFISLGLARKLNQPIGTIITPILDKWIEFIVKEQIASLEVTYFTVNKKRHVYLRIGVWTDTHTSKRPESIWKEAKQNHYPIPKLRISSVAMRLVTGIGQNFTFVNDADSDDCGVSLSSETNDFENEEEEDYITASSSDEDSNGESSDSEMSASSSDEDSNSESSDSGMSDEEAMRDDFDAGTFPLLYRLGVLGVKIKDKGVHDCLLRELLKFNGGEEIQFMGGSNRPTTVLKIPQPTKVSNLQLLLNRNGSCVDKMVKIMAD